MKRVLYARRLVTPRELISDAALLLEDGTIAAVGPRATVRVPEGTRSDDYGDAVLAPGLVDIHVHGGAGVDAMDADAAGLAKMRRHLARHGVTSFLATTVTAPWPRILAAVAQLGKTGLGIHMEGPFLSPQRRGVHPEADLLLPSPAQLDEVWERSGGNIRLITLAPELEGAMEFIAAAGRLGIRVSLGHSDASLAQAQAGWRAGAVHVTHTFNAMRPLHQRELGLLGLALAEPSLSAEIIADGLHVDPLLVGMFVRLKAPGAAVLVSDGISATGCGDGQYALGGIGVSVCGNRCTAGGTLAGSVLTLDEAVRNVRTWTGYDWAPAIAMASLNPADLMGWRNKGRLEAGADADVAVFSPNGEILATYVAGKLES
jgi:N-acetylglucosamine-6-phosphate deacetylase